MYFNIKCIGKLPGLTNEFERSPVFETGEFERPKFDCMSFNTIHKNKILAKISEFTVLLNFDKDHVYGIEVMILIKF